MTPELEASGFVDAGRPRAGRGAISRHALHPTGGRLGERRRGRQFEARGWRREPLRTVRDRDAGAGVPP